MRLAVVVRLPLPVQRAEPVTGTGQAARSGTPGSAPGPEGVQTKAWP